MTLRSGEPETEELQKDLQHAGAEVTSAEWKLAPAALSEGNWKRLHASCSAKEGTGCRAPVPLAEFIRPFLPHSVKNR